MAPLQKNTKLKYLQCSKTIGMLMAIKMKMTLDNQFAHDTGYECGMVGS
jgi:hypothetical protein